MKLAIIHRALAFVVVIDVLVVLFCVLVVSALGSGCYRTKGIITCADGACPAGYTCDELGICRDDAGAVGDSSVPADPAPGEDGDGDIDDPTLPPPDGDDDDEPVVPPDEPPVAPPPVDDEIDPVPVPFCDAVGAGAGALVCDDFESNSLDAWDFTVVIGATLEPTEVQAFGGAFGMLASSPKFEAIVVADVFADDLQPAAGATSADVWWRGRVYLPSTTSFNVESPLVAFGPGPFGPFISLMLVDGTDELYVLTKIFDNDVGDGEGASTTTVTLARDTWTCVELRVEVNADAAGAVELHVEDQLIESEPDLTTFTPESLVNVAVGVAATEAQPAMEVFFDDVVISRSRVGCAL